MTPRAKINKTSATESRKGDFKKLKLKSLISSRQPEPKGSVLALVGSHSVQDEKLGKLTRALHLPKKLNRSVPRGDGCVASVGDGRSH